MAGKAKKRKGTKRKTARKSPAVALGMGSSVTLKCKVTRKRKKGK